MGAGRLTPGISKALTGIATVASTGTLTPNAQTAPSASEDEWVQLNFLLSPENQTGNGPSNPFHHQAVYAPTTNEIILSWETPTTNRFGTFAFHCGTHTWRRTNDWAGGVDDLGNYRGLGQRENHGGCFDPTLNGIWYSAGAPNGVMPSGYEARYDVATDIFIPFSEPSLNFGLLNGRVMMGAVGNRVYSWNGAGFKYYNVGTQSSTPLTNPNAPFQGGNGTSDLRLNAQARGALNRSGNYLWMVDINCDFWKADLSVEPPVFVKYTTTGDKPAGNHPDAPPTYPTCPIGVVYGLHEARNVIVGMIAGCYENGASDTGNPVNKTWVLDLDTLVWRFGPRLDAGDTFPCSASRYKGATGIRPVYDSTQQRLLFTVGFSSVCEVWEFRARFTSRWESFEVPTATGTTYGVNYVGFPFVRNAGSKNMCMGATTITNRLYVSGGDCGSNPGSASDVPGVWSMSLADGTWRLDSGYNADSNWPYPQPNGYQDGSLLGWSNVHNKFVFGFNPGESYNQPGDFLWQYATGVWLYDPTLYPDPDAWTQDLSLSPNPNAQEPSSGCDYGGIYDDATDCVIAPNASATALLRWHIGTMTRLSNLSITVNASGLGKSFNRSKPVQLGRYLWQLGVFTDGGSIRQGKMIKVHIDTGAVTVYDTPAGVTLPATVNCHLETSNSKIVWCKIDSVAVGNVEGIYVFDPVSETWSEDATRPAYGTFVTNTSCSLPDGRICYAGGGNGVLPTHMWFYTAP